MEPANSPTTTEPDREPSDAQDESHALGTISLLCGVFGLLLAILPPLIFSEPIDWPWSEPEKEEAPRVNSDAEGTVTIETKRFSLRIGKRDDAASRPAIAPRPPPPPPPPPPRSRPYRVASIVVAVLGLAVVPFAWLRERRHAVAGTGAALCCAALVWQYVVAGLAVGAAIAILLVLISALAG